MISLEGRSHINVVPSFAPSRSSLKGSKGIHTKDKRVSSNVIIVVSSEL